MDDSFLQKKAPHSIGLKRLSAHLHANAVSGRWCGRWWIKFGGSPISRAARPACRSPLQSAAPSPKPGIAAAVASSSSRNTNAKPPSSAFNTNSKSTSSEADTTNSTAGGEIATQTNLCAALPTKLDDSGRGKGRRNVVLAQCSRGVSRRHAVPREMFATLHSPAALAAAQSHLRASSGHSSSRGHSARLLASPSAVEPLAWQVIAALPAPRARLLPPQPPDNLGDCPRTQLIFHLACKCHATIPSASFRAHTRHSGFKARTPASYCPEGLSHWLSYAGCRVAVPAPLYSQYIPMWPSPCTSRGNLLPRESLRHSLLAGRRYAAGPATAHVCASPFSPTTAASFTLRSAVKTAHVPQTVPSPSCRPPGSTSVPLSAFQRRRFPAQQNYKASDALKTGEASVLFGGPTLRLPTTVPYLSYRLSCRFGRCFPNIPPALQPWKPPPFRRTDLGCGPPGPDLLIPKTGCLPNNALKTHSGSELR
ncbi:hypothetical protein B0H14DRAFT_3718256 [Mycena olivaceomarginata]|nr:hypothetical protein B0H14DRAFT_3718256 [Mycena olivaceomarginata]